MVDKDYANLEEIKNNTVCLDDFDDNGHYRGNSYYTITIKR